MVRLFRLARSHPKASAATSRTAASLPSSGFTFIDNSQGASAAIAELSDALGTALDQIDLDGTAPSMPNIRQLPSTYNDPGDPVDRLRKLFQDLDQEASQYTNCKISDVDIEKHQWECSQPLAHLISATWACALAVYSNPTLKIPDTHHHRFLPDHVILPSLGGTVKVMTSHIVEPENLEPSSKFFPALVIAIRGTASTVDGIVNLNGEPRDAGRFLVSFLFGHFLYLPT